MNYFKFYDGLNFCFFNCVLIFGASIKKLAVMPCVVIDQANLRFLFGVVTN